MTNNYKLRKKIENLHNWLILSSRSEIKITQALSLYTKLPCS